MKRARLIALASSRCFLADTAVMREGKAYVQAAAGIVADSLPDFEEAETRHKARAVLRAIALAETLRPASDMPPAPVAGP